MMKFASTILSLALVLASVSHAQTPDPDLTGRWIGAADTTDEGGTKRQEKQTIEIRIEDGKLTAVSVGRTGKGVPLQALQAGSKINLYGYLTLDGGEHLRWKLELKDGKLVGSFSAQHNSPLKWVYDRVGAMTMTKETGVILRQ